MKVELLFLSIHLVPRTSIFRANIIAHCNFFSYYFCIIWFVIAVSACQMLDEMLDSTCKQSWWRFDEPLCDSSIRFLYPLVTDRRTGGQTGQSTLLIPFGGSASGSPLWVVTHIGINRVTRKPFDSEWLPKERKIALDCLTDETHHRNKMLAFDHWAFVDGFPCGSHYTWKRQQQHWRFPWKQCRHTPKGAWRYIYSRPRPFLHRAVARDEAITSVCSLRDLCAH